MFEHEMLYGNGRTSREAQRLHRGGHDVPVSTAQN